MSHINKGFTFQTNRAAYKAEFDGFEVGAEKWLVKIQWVSHNALKQPSAILHLPADWSRTAVFQFLNDMDEGKASQVELLEQQAQQYRNKIQQLETTLRETPISDINNRHYLASRVDPAKVYTVSYTVNGRGERVPGEAPVLGRDLTRHQIDELHQNGQI